MSATRITTRMEVRTTSVAVTQTLNHCITTVGQTADLSPSSMTDGSVSRGRFHFHRCMVWYSLPSGCRDDGWVEILWLSVWLDGWVEIMVECVTWWLGGYIVAECVTWWLGGDNGWVCDLMAGWRWMNVWVDGWVEMLWLSVWLDGWVEILWLGVWLDGWVEILWLSVWHDGWVEIMAECVTWWLGGDGWMCDLMGGWKC